MESANQNDFLGVSSLGSGAPTFGVGKELFLFLFGFIYLVSLSL
jgi:hypothetical protein